MPTPPKRISEANLFVALSTWRPLFERRFPEEMARARQEFRRALVMAGPGKAVPEREIGAHESSLVPQWASLYRPMADGRLGADLARAEPLVGHEPLASAIERASAAHALVADLVGFEAKRNIATLRSVFDSSVYHVPVLPSAIPKMQRWARFFTLLVDRGDGLWSQPSVLTTTPYAQNVAPEAFWAALTELAARLDYPASQVDRERPHQTVARLAAIAYAAFVRLAIPTPEEEQDARKRPFAVTNEGDPVELLTLHLDLKPEQREQLGTRLGKEPGFEGVDDGWVWSTQTEGAFSGGRPEAVGSVHRGGRGEPWELRALSARRAERLRDLLSTLLGSPVQVTKTETHHVWEENPQYAREESEDTKRVVIASNIVRTAQREPPSLNAAALAHLKRSLEMPIVMLDGRSPRQAAETEEGRSKLETWLRLAEAPKLGGWSGQLPFVDVDPIRRELGLPTIEATFPPPPAGVAPGLEVQAQPPPSRSFGLEPAAAGPRVGRNDPCPCGSGQKYKKCHGR